MSYSKNQVKYIENWYRAILKNFYLHLPEKYMEGYAIKLIHISSLICYIVGLGEFDLVLLYCSWFSRYPAQIILLVDSIMWSHLVDEVLKDWSEDGLRELESTVQTKIIKYGCGSLY